MRKAFNLKLAAWVSVLLLSKAHGTILDSIVFGDTASETAHALISPLTPIISGGLGQPARRMLWDPADTTVKEGGYLEFNATCDPLAINYVTLKLWGSDTNKTASGVLHIYQVEGSELYQVGYRNIQAYEYSPLAWATRSEKPIYERFYYTTIPLPLSLTQGRSSVRLRILGAEMNSLGSLPVYRAYVHCSSYFVPPAGDPQSPEPAPAPVRPTNGASLPVALARARQQSISDMTSWLANGNGDLNQLITGYTVAWTPAYQNPLIPPRVVASIDSTCQGYFANPGSAGSAWGGAFGWVGERVGKIGAAAFGAAALDEVIDLGDPAGPAARRVLWAKMLKASRDAGRFGRRGPTTNQGIICDKEIYNANKGLLVISSPDAFTDERAKQYLLEAVGLLPWPGPDLAGGGNYSFMGSNYYIVTPAGLTKENGYVAAYGEVYDVSTAYWPMTGDLRFKNRAAEMFRARSYFRFPMMDADGFRSFMMVGPLDWRSHQTFPFDPAYGERYDRIAVALATQDPYAIGYARQMFDDNQGGIFGTDLNAAIALETLVNTPDSGERLPMGKGQPDYAWADVDNGIVAIKHGEELTWIEPYWQARNGLHSTGRAMQITPTEARLSYPRNDMQFKWNGTWSSKPDGVGWDAAPLVTPNGLVHQAYLGDKFVQAQAPLDAQQNREEFIGRASFYATRYGRYLVGINMDKVNSYVLKTPAGFTSAPELITKQTLSGVITVAPFSAVVLDLGSNEEVAPRPHTPRYIAATGIPGAVSVYWDTVGGASSYNLKRATSSSGPFTAIATGLGGNYPLQWGAWPYGFYRDTTVASGTTYFYQVSGVNAAGESYDSPLSKGGSATTAIASVNALPAPWKNLNFSGNGSASHNAGTFTLNGGGGDFWNTADGGHFVYQMVNGDCTLIARMTALGGAYKAGLMIRDTLASNSAEICAIQQSGGLGGYRRNSTAGSTVYNGSGTGTAPRWFKLQRRGKNITLSHAPDESGAPGAWIEISTSGAEISSTAYIGLATTSGSPVFDQVSVTNFNITLPTAPPEVTATAGNGQVVLNWLPTSGASTYTVKRSSVSGGPYTVIASGLTTLGFTHGGLINGAPYFYVVSAVNTLGTGPDSAEASAIPTALPLPPSNLAVTTTGTQAVITWSASAGTTSYQILRSTDGVTWAIVATGLSGTGYTDAGLALGQSYDYAVRAVNGNGMSAPSSHVIRASAPLPPRLLKAAGSGTGGLLQWTTATGSVSYQIKRATSSGGTFTPVASNLTRPFYKDAGLTAGSDYFYLVTASNAAGESAPSAEIKLGWGTGLLAQYYNNTASTGTPALTRIDPDFTSVNWGQSSPDPAVNADNFSVIWSGQLEAIATGTHSFAINGLDDGYRLWLNGTTVIDSAAGIRSGTFEMISGVKYDIRAQFWDGSGAAYADMTWSSPAFPASSIPACRLYPALQQPRRATGGTATANAQNGTSESAAKAFDANTATKWFTGINGVAGWLRYQLASGAISPINQYQITSANDVPQRDPKNWQFQASNDGTTWSTLDTRTGEVFSARFQTKIYLMSNTTAYTYYRLNITANSGGSGYGIQLSELALISPASLTSPPAVLSAVPGSGQVTLSWSPVSGAASYQIKRSVHDGGPYIRVATVSGINGFTDAGLVNGFTYHYVVSSIAASGEGEDSCQATAKLAAQQIIQPVQDWELIGPPLQLTGGNITISPASSVPGRIYQLQRSYTLSGNWENIGPAQTGGSPLSFSDTPQPAQGKAFYRIKITP
ncbi:MAG: PA14 domain-containing protein [Luteolibacter sp.]